MWVTNRRLEVTVTQTLVRLRELDYKGGIQVGFGQDLREINVITSLRAIVT